MSSDLKIKSLNSIIRGAGVFMVGRVVANALGFTLNLILTTTLGASLYGIYAYAKTIITASIVFTNLGADKSMLKYIPQYEDDQQKLQHMLGLGFITSIIGSLIVAGSLFVLAPWIATLTIQDPRLADTIRLFTLVLVFDTIAKVINATFRGLEIARLEVLVSKILRPGIRLASISVALLLGLSYFGLMVALTTASGVILAGAIYLVVTRTSISPDLRGISAEDAKEYYDFSIPLTLKDAAQFLQNRVDVLMTGFFLTSAAVGIYNISILVSSLLAMPLAAVNQLFPPVASRLYSENHIEELTSIYSTATRWIFTVSLILSIGAIVYRAEILSIFGAEFERGVTVLTLLVLGRFVNNSTGSNGYILMMSGNQYIVLGNQWLFGLLNVVLNYAFIMEFGIEGAALATATVLALLNIAEIVEIWYLEGLFPYSTKFFKPLVSGSIAAVVMVFFTTQLSGLKVVFIGGGFGAIMYFVLLIGLGIEEEDREFFNRVIKPRLEWVD